MCGRVVLGSGWPRLRSCTTDLSFGDADGVIPTGPRGIPAGDAGGMPWTASTSQPDVPIGVSEEPRSCQEGPAARLELGLEGGGDYRWVTLAVALTRENAVRYWVRSACVISWHRRERF